MIQGNYQGNRVLMKPTPRSQCSTTTGRKINICRLL